MASPITKLSAKERIKTANSKFRGTSTRFASLHEASYSNFWGGDIDNTVLNAEALNEFAADTTTESDPQTALSLFTDHAAIADLVRQVTPELTVSAPPIDMTTVFNEDGSMDVVELRRLLEEL